MVRVVRVGAVLADKLVGFSHDLALLLRGKVFDRTPVIVEIIERPLILAQSGAMFASKIFVTPIGWAVKNRAWVIAIGRKRIGSVAIVQGWWIRIPVATSIACVRK